VALAVHRTPGVRARHELTARAALVCLAAALAACGGGVTPSAPAWPERVAPARAPEPGRRPPLVVLLHGIGADEDDLFALARALDPRATVVSVGGPHAYYGGRAWFHIDFAPGGRVIPDVAQARATLAELLRWLETAPVRYGTDPARTFLLGFSQGGMMALGVLGAVPERLAGVVVLSSRFSDQLFPPTAAPDAIARVPLFVAHGTLDQTLPVANGRALRAAFEPTTTDFTYREYRVAHGIAEGELADVAAWIAARL
jgi:phospholipase/carboxylesterase